MSHGSFSSGPARRFALVVAQAVSSGQQVASILPWLRGPSAMKASRTIPDANSVRLLELSSRYKHHVVIRRRFLPRLPVPQPGPNRQHDSRG